MSGWRPPSSLGNFACKLRKEDCASLSVFCDESCTTNPLAAPSGAGGMAAVRGRAAGRFVVNSTVGLLGLFDVATRWGLEPHESDFGQTLGRYGAQPGPYIFVPVIGPSNLRDGIGRIVDVATDPIGFLTGPITSTAGGVRYGVTALDQRALSDPAFEALKDATDPYVTTRSAYTQYRADAVRRATGETQALPDFDAEPGAQ